MHQHHGICQNLTFQTFIPSIKGPDDNVLPDLRVVLLHTDLEWNDKKKLEAVTIYSQLFPYNKQPKHVCLLGPDVPGLMDIWKVTKEDRQRTTTFVPLRTLNVAEMREIGINELSLEADMKALVKAGLGFEEYDH